VRGDGVEFPDRDPGQRAAGEDEVLDTSSQANLLGRIPVWLRAGLAVAVAAGLVAVALNQANHSHSSSAQAPQTSAPVTSVPAAAPTMGIRTGSADVRAASPALVRADAMDRLAYLADFRNPLLNNLRGLGVTPTCPQIPIGDNPAARVAAALRRHLHSVAVRDSSVTMNADATLCGMDVRARAAKNARVVVEIVAPPHAMDVALRAQRRSGDRVLRAVGVAVDRWQITVGWAGPTARAPSATALAAIARDRHLRW
jgi:hypothetical protein